MKILFYDCFAGISGDMNLAAMLDLGVDENHLRTELSKLGLDHEFELRVGRDCRKGIHGTRVDVVLKGHEHHEHGDHHHGHEHAHHDGHEHHEHEHMHHDGHEHHDHDHSHQDGHDHHEHHGHEHAHHEGHEHPHQHRNLRDIETIITASGLPDAVQKTSLAMFRKVAEAEAKVHGKGLYEVHFHEVGATDSIVDMVGAAICYHALGVDAVWASPVELGGGFVHCAHGDMPVPAPATVEILQGIPSTRGGVQHEATTPTGAAILATLVSRYTATPEMVLEKTAYGIGHRDTDKPNLLRTHLAHQVDQDQSSAGGRLESARILQCNIDDMTAEMLGAVMDLLMERGALDVHYTPILMKKNRPATCVSLLCAPVDEEKFKQLLFRHTTTLGIKSFTLEKTVLATEFERLETPLGPVSMKNALQDGRVIRSKPELEDCRELAKRHDIPLCEVYEHIGRSKK